MFGAAPTYNEGVAPSPVQAAAGVPFATITRVFTGDFNILRDGWYTVYAWGGGSGGAQQRGRAGGRGKRRVYCRKGEKISVSLGAGGAGLSYSTGYGNPGGNTIITFPDGSVMTCTGANQNTSGSFAGADEGYIGGGGVQPRLNSTGNVSFYDPGEGNTAFPDLPGVVGIGGQGAYTWQVNNNFFGGGDGQAAEGFGAGGGCGASSPGGSWSGTSGALGACIIKEEGLRNV